MIDKDLTHTGKADTTSRCERPELAAPPATAAADLASAASTAAATPAALDVRRLSRVLPGWVRVRRAAALRRVVATRRGLGPRLAHQLAVPAPGNHLGRGRPEDDRTVRLRRRRQALRGPDGRRAGGDDHPL